MTIVKPPKLRLVKAAPPPTLTPPRGLSDADELRAILLEALGQAPPAELLDGPAGLVSVVRLWAPVLARGPRRRRPPATPLDRLIELQEATLRELERLAELFPAGSLYGRLIREKRAEQAAWAEGWLLAPHSPPPAWHQAAWGLVGAVAEAFREAELEPPSEKRLAEAAALLLARLGVSADGATVRSAVRRFRGRTIPVAKA